MSKPSKPCLFCGLPGDKSREHIFPRWMKDIVRSDFGSPLHLVNRYDHETKVIEISHGRLNRPGRLIDQTIKLVCRSCNNEWMSRLQQQAKPVLEPVIAGAAPVSSLVAHARLVSRWCAMSDMVFEALEPSLATSTAGERLWLKEKDTAPPNWRIWVGQLEEAALEPSHSRSALALVKPGDVPVANAHFDFVVAGHFAYVSASSPPEDTVLFPRLNALLRPLLPLFDASPKGQHVPLRSEAEFADLWARVKIALH